MTIAARHRRIVSRGDIPGSDGGIYNPGAIKRGSGIVLLCRREIDYRFTPFVHPEQLTLDADTLAIREHRTLRRHDALDGVRIEDFRCIDYRADALVIHTTIRAGRIRPALSRVVAGTLEPAGPIELPIATAPIEKNWVLFDHDDTLHCVYQLDPLTIFARQEGGDWRLVRREHNGWADRFRNPLSNSANLIPFMDGYLGFWHSIVDRRYVQGAVLLGRDLTIQYRTPVLLDGGTIRTGFKPGVLYVSSLVEHGNNVLAFYGEGDAHTSVAIFDAAELASELRRHPFVPVAGIKLRFAGCTLGELFRALASIQSLSRERGAPHLWLHLDNPRLAPIVRRFGIPNLSVRTLPLQTQFDRVFGAMP